jgi:antitoxin component of MazEF toxin-antitoxin module
MLPPLLYSIYTIFKEMSQMGYQTKIQKVERPTNQSFYVNLPSAVAQSMGIEKGDVFEWAVENKNLLLLKRVKKQKSFKSRKFVL